MSFSLRDSCFLYLLRGTYYVCPNFSVQAEGLSSYLKVKMVLITCNHNFVIFMFKGKQSFELNIFSLTSVSESSSLANFDE